VAAAGKDFGEGIFTMEFIKLCDSWHKKEMWMDSKERVRLWILASVATKKNKEAALLMLDRARDAKQLISGMTNFMLAHMGMKVIK
jgi:hypothetical protein